MVYSHRDDLHKIIVLNPKGGCGKTTLAVNIASYFALRGPMPTLIDYDPQGFATEWLQRRPTNRPIIHGIAPHKHSIHTTLSWQLRLPAETDTVIIDTPAALDGSELHDLAYEANCIIVPIMPSAIDIRNGAKFIAELLLLAQIERDNRTLAIVASRTRHNTRTLKQLMRFLSSLRIPIIAILRDSQNFVQAANEGIGIHEMPAYQVRKDIGQLNLVMRWIEQSRLTNEQINEPIPVQAELPLPGRPLH